MVKVLDPVIGTVNVRFGTVVIAHGEPHAELQTTVTGSPTALPVAPAKSNVTLSVIAPLVVDRRMSWLTRNVHVATTAPVFVSTEFQRRTLFRLHISLRVTTQRLLAQAAGNPMAGTAPVWASGEDTVLPLFTQATCLTPRAA